MNKKKIVLSKLYSPVDVQNMGLITGRRGNSLNRSVCYKYMRDGLIVSKNLSKGEKPLYRATGRSILRYIRKYQPDRIKLFNIEK